MAIKAALHHLTHYRYERPTLLSPHIIRLRPAPHCRTPILSYSLRIVPADHFINWQQDPFANYQARIVFPERINEFRIEVDLIASMEVFNPFDFFVEPEAEQFPFAYSELTRKDLAPYMSCPEPHPKIDAYLASIDKKPQATVDFLVALNAQLQKDITYTIRLEPGIQTPHETLKLATGSCRDSAWLLITLLRRLGFACRFVSGYLIQLKPDQKSLDGPSGAESDFTDLHAWAEVFLPGAGWVGLDPTSGLFAGEGHIPLACTPDPQSASPVSGALEQVETAFTFDMQVTRVAEKPRISKPYADEAWERLLVLGDTVDKRLNEMDVRLTMGGEPTFISIDDMDGPEWNTTAVGPEKLKRSIKLLRRLHEQFAPGGILHYGQGKWYPGESLPRWAFTCYWRPDGVPLWQKPELLADIETDYGHNIEHAKRFATALGETLGVRVDTLLPAHEDTFYHLWKEDRLPHNVSPSDNRLKDPEERARLSKVFSTGLDTPRAWVLPLQKLWQASPKWTSTPWKIRSGHLFLTPGDSAVGLRLPLESLGFIPPSKYPFIRTSDPIAAAARPLPDLRQHFNTVQDRSAGGTVNNPDTQPTRQSLDKADTEARTALCVEPRNGKLFVFLPPVACLEDYLELVAAVEATASKLGYPVVIEGEKPPPDLRVRQFSITPDPGVIEVNIQPAASWRELVDIVTNLYEQARLTRLGTSKFMLDGRHTGTGGGNHIVLGGATPGDSPFLRRPDLLRSLIAFWHHHPSLSYLFSSLFIGPSSQSPRVDEARDDALYEMEIAFGEIDRSPQAPPPWLVDRIFRNLLTDVTGNTHRAEFCIDKLYNPDSSNGRLGLLELRSFEMPPDARMSLAQNLIIRGLIARFWESPYYPRRLIRWGTDLHDRMLMPHYLWEDFLDVIADLKEHGYPFSEEWFKAHFEFRFPFFGHFSWEDTIVEIRQALEPWHVLGEEGLAGGAVRFVDSSVERIQVKVYGFIPDRYLLACNGHRIPLRPTGIQGEWVAAVRYRAWQPPSALHPTIPPDSPLVIDLIDSWTGRALTGCRYHVGHPAGRNYTTFPINSYEAESRRLSRFEAIGHTPGHCRELPGESSNPEFPNTLDLRRFVPPGAP